MTPPEYDEPTLTRDPLIGVALGNYVVKELMGRGGMGVVYRAEQPDIGKTVAIKVLKQDVEDASQLDRLAEEARVINKLRHRGIIDIFGFGTAPDGRPYIVMEYLEGEPLDAYLARVGRLPPLEAIAILDEILLAVGAAHRAGVIHRDLKPGNIFRAQDSDGRPYLKILDFGLAKRTQPHGSASQTARRAAGTPEYMAPEQALGDRVAPASDLYAIGIIGYELLAGKTPFHGNTYLELFERQINDPAPSLRAHDLAIPLELDQLVLELLRKTPAERPRSAEEVRARLKPVALELARAGTQVDALHGLQVEVARREAPTPAAATPPAQTPPWAADSREQTPLVVPPSREQTVERVTGTAPMVPVLATALEHRARRARWPLVFGGVSVLAGVVAAALQLPKFLRAPPAIVAPVTVAPTAAPSSSASAPDSLEPDSAQPTPAKTRPTKAKQTRIPMLAPTPTQDELRAEVSRLLHRAESHAGYADAVRALQIAQDRLASPLPEQSRRDMLKYLVSYEEKLPP